MIKKYILSWKDESGEHSQSFQEKSRYSDLDCDADVHNWVTLQYKFHELKFKKTQWVRVQVDEKSIFFSDFPVKSYDQNTEIEDRMHNLDAWGIGDEDVETSKDVFLFDV